MNLALLAVIAGAFTSGAMMSICMVSVPILYDTNATAYQLLYQWTTLYGYGHRVMPALAIATFSLHLYAAYSYSSSSLRSVAPHIFVLAAVVTVLMIPYTWVVMTHTNNTMFGLEEHARTSAGAASLAEARELLTKWNRLHFVRSLFPLAGAAIGAAGASD